MMIQQETPLGEFEDLMEEMSGCSVCRALLPGACSPRVQISPETLIVIIGSYPDPHATDGCIWDSNSEHLLCSWLGVTPEVLRTDPRLGHLPLGFCCPVLSPYEVAVPPPVCAPLWHPRFLSLLSRISLKILVGDDAQRYYLGRACAGDSTEMKEGWQHYLPDYVPLPSTRVPIGSNEVPWESEWFAELRKYLSGRVSSLLST